MPHGIRGAWAAEPVFISSPEGRVLRSGRNFERNRATVRTDRIMDDEEMDHSLYVVALYGVLSFISIMLIVLLLYVACARKYRLNWFEKNLLENAEAKEVAHSREALVGFQESTPSSSKVSYPMVSEEGKFWVPYPVNKQNSLSDSSPDVSTPGSPTSSSSYQPTIFSGPMPIARSDKHVVLTNNSPIRPRVSSMQSKLDHTKIDTSLYQMESPGEPEDVRGSVHVTLTYDPVAGILTVRLVEAHDLQARDFSGTADPYAKIRLLPDKANVWQTRIHKKTLNPVFDEDFVFEVTPATLGRHTLEVFLYDFDAYSRHHNIGGIQLPLGNIDFTDKVDMWKGLSPCTDRDNKADLGDLMVSLAYLPSAERLTVVILKARNLRVVDDTRSSSDPYVKVCLLQGHKRIKKRKTGVHRNTTNPVFNEALTFDIDKESLKKCTLEFYVMHDSLLGASELLGRCRVGRGPECQPEEKEFFVEMLHSKTATAKWMSLADPRTPP